MIYPKGFKQAVLDGFEISVDSACRGYDSTGCSGGVECNDCKLSFLSPVKKVKKYIKKWRRKAEEEQYVSNVVANANARIEELESEVADKNKLIRQISTNCKKADLLCDQKQAEIEDKNRLIASLRSSTVEASRLNMTRNLNPETIPVLSETDAKKE